MNLDGRNISDADRLALMRDCELEETRALEAMTRRVVVDPRLEETIDIEILALQRLLDVSRFKRLMSIQPREFGQLDQVERRLLLRAAKGFSRRFGEIEAWMGRNVAAETAVPEFLRARAAL